MPAARRRVLVIAALAAAGVAAFFCLWIVVPAPLYVLWVAGVVGTELSLWWGLLGLLVGAALGLLAARSGARRAGAAAVVLGLFAAAAALVPLAESRPVAQANRVHLSVRRFFLGVPDPAAAAVRPETVTYAVAGGQRLRADVYRAATARGAAAAAPSPSPSVIVVHGGSWRGGRRSDFAHWDRWLAARGYAVFDVDYRLAPQPNWREAAGDVKAAVAWVRRHAADYGADPDRLALLGRSAGAHLALLAAYTPGDAAALPPSDAPATADTRVRAVVSLYGPTDLVWGYDHPAVPDVIDGPGTLRRFLGGSPSQAPAAYAEAAPIGHVGPDTPPTLLVHGGRDLLVGPQHSERLAARLAAAGVPYRLVVIPYALHGFDYFINGWGAQIEQPVLLGFLRKSLAPRTETAK